MGTLQQHGAGQGIRLRVPHKALLLTSGLLLVWGLYAGTLPSPPSQHATPATCQGQPGSQASLPPPWHAVRDCKIYILDLSTDVAPALGIPQCDINDPKVWPLAEPGELPWSMQHMKAMPHMHFQYAGQYWLTQALRNASGVLTDNIDEACLVWVDTYCYHQWFIIQRAIKLRSSWLKGYTHNESHVFDIYAQALDYVTSSARFQKRQGRDYVFSLPIRDGRPGAPFSKLCTDMLRSHTLIPDKLVTCPDLRPKLALRETQMVPFCTGENIEFRVAGRRDVLHVADVGDLAAPIVGSQRPTFLYMAASCQKGNDNCGKFMRYSAAVAFNDTAPDVQVMCTTSKDSKSYSEVQLEMRNSVFCLLPPGDYPCSNRLSEAILSGCIPVFIGPPWHEIPFHRGEVDWASMAVFLNITSEPSWLESPDCRSKQQKWYQSADVGFATVAVPDLPAAYEYLRRMPKDALQRHQAALERERPKFFYGTALGRQFSALADVVFGNLIAYGQRIKAGEYAA